MTETEPKIVKVLWFDAHTRSEVSAFNEIERIGLCHSIAIGYLLHENEERIAVCGFLFPDGDLNLSDPKNMTGFREVHFIPKSQIKKIISLKEKNDITHN